MLRDSCRAGRAPQRGWRGVGGRGWGGTTPRRRRLPRGVVGKCPAVPWQVAAACCWRTPVEVVGVWWDFFPLKPSDCDHVQCPVWPLWLLLPAFIFFFYSPSSEDSVRVGLTQEECRQISRADLFSDCRDIPLFYGFASHATVGGKEQALASFCFN